MQACSVVLRTPRCDWRTSGCGKAERSNPASVLTPRHFRLPPSSRSPSRSAADGVPGIIRATAKQTVVKSITPNERVPSFRAFDICSLLCLAPACGFYRLAGFFDLVIYVNVQEKERARG